MTGRVSKQERWQAPASPATRDATMKIDDRCYRQRYHLTVLTSSPLGLARTLKPEVNHFRYVEILFKFIFHR